MGYHKPTISQQWMYRQEFGVSFAALARGLPFLRRGIQSSTRLSQVYGGVFTEDHQTYGWSRCCGRHGDLVRSSIFSELLCSEDFASSGPSHENVGETYRFYLSCVVPMHEARGWQFASSQVFRPKLLTCAWCEICGYFIPSCEEYVSVLSAFIFKFKA